MSESPKFPIELDYEIDQLADLNQIDVDRVALDASLRVVTDRVTEGYANVGLRSKRWWAALVARHDIVDSDRLLVARKRGKYFLELRPAQKERGGFMEGLFGRGTE